VVAFFVRWNGRVELTAVVNEAPVALQSRGLSEPQRVFDSPMLHHKKHRHPAVIFYMLERESRTGHGSELGAVWHRNVWLRQS
jgi:hypothetical protein